MVRLTLSFDFIEDVLTEALATTLPDLFAAIGGNIGLFTGFSLFTVVAFLEKILHTVQEKTRGLRCPRIGFKKSEEGKIKPTITNPRVKREVGPINTNPSVLKGNRIEVLEI